MTLIWSQDDGLAPNYVYIEPIQDFYSGAPIEIEVIVTDRSEIELVKLFYRFSGKDNFSSIEMVVSDQPVLYKVEIPFDEVEPGSLQYYFWSKDIYNNQSTWPEGGEDLPMVLPVFATIQKKDKKKQESISIKSDDLEEARTLESTMPFYIEVDLISPQLEVESDEGVPIIVLSIYDPEKTIISQDVKFYVDDVDQTKNVFLSSDMLTYIPTKIFDPGYHFIRFQVIDSSGELMIQDYAFNVKEEVVDADEKKVDWREKYKFKGDSGWNIDYDQTPNRPVDTHKFNTKFKFALGNYKFGFSASANTHIYDANARNELKTRQPVNRLKFNLKSSKLNINYGDNSPEFSELTLKGTRVRGLYSSLKLGWWETLFVTGESKHWLNSSSSSLDLWDPNSEYTQGDTVFYNGFIWVAKQRTYFAEPDTSININSPWEVEQETEFGIVSNDSCNPIEPAEYGMAPVEGLLGIGGGFYWIWNGNQCEEVLVYSSINMLTGSDDQGEKLHYTEGECINECGYSIIYNKGTPIRKLTGARTSIDLFNLFKLGVSGFQSYDQIDDDLFQFQSFRDKYTFMGNLVIGTDFMLHLNSDKTILSGEYGVSIAMDQDKPNHNILLSMAGKDPSDNNLYSYTDWSNVDYCYLNECIDINEDDFIITSPQIIYGLSYTDPDAWQKVLESQEKLNYYSEILGFKITDDIANVGEGQGISGLTAPEFADIINGNLDPIDLLLDRGTYRLEFRTPIPLIITELDFKSEYKHMAPNYFSLGNSSVQTDLQSLKTSGRMKLFKNQLSISGGYDLENNNIIPSLRITDGSTTYSNTISGSAGLNLSSLPALNYSIRNMSRMATEPNVLDTTKLDTSTNNNTITHTFAPTYKFKYQSTNIGLNGNIMIMNYHDIGSDTVNLDFMTNAYTGAVALTFDSPLSINLGAGISSNIPGDITQSKTVFSVLSTKLGYKFKEGAINTSLGINFVIGKKDRNGYYDSGEQFFDCGQDSLGVQYCQNDENWDESYGDGEWSEGEQFDDNIEIDNNKVAVKFGVQYKVNKDFSVGLNMDYSSSSDNLDVTKNKSTFKSKIQIKYGF